MLNPNRSKTTPNPGLVVIKQLTTIRDIYIYIYRERERERERERASN